MLHKLLALLRRQPALLRNDLTKDHIYLTRHVGSITADVEISLLEEEVVDKLGMFAQLVLDVDLCGGLTGEGGDDLEGRAKF